jgi:hypothetical protein
VDLARVARPDDFIVSQRIVSLLVAQLSENPGLFDVFNQLLDPFGCEKVMVPAQDLISQLKNKIKKHKKSIYTQQVDEKKKI